MGYAGKSNVRAYYWLIFSALMSCGAKAVADDSLTALSYEAPWECPNRDEFWRQLRARSTRLAQGSPEVLGVRINARISGSSSSYQGHLTLVGADNTVVERDVGGPNCADVTAALALMTAVTLDSAPARTRTDFSVTARPRKDGKRFAVGAVGGIHTGVAPSHVPTLGLSLTYHDRTLFGSPEFRITGLFAESAWQPVFSGGDARFLWFAARASACPLQAQVGSIAFGPCGIVELGALEGEGRTSRGVRAQTGWWFAPGALMNWSVQADPVWFRLAAGGVVPVVRDPFQFNPKPEVFRPHGFNWTAEVELSWSFK